MKKNLTELVFILDGSGSMSGLEEDTIGGFNGMLKKQRQEKGEVLVSTIVFSDSSRVIHDRVPLAKIEMLTHKDYSVGGGTALLDAIGNAMHHISNIHKYAREEDVPAHTLFVITTDGEENASLCYTSTQIKQMIEVKKEKGWEFLFLAANIDAIATAEEYGIAEDRAVNYRNTKRGVRCNSAVLSKTISSYRKVGKVSNCWKKEIEKNNR